MGLKLKGINATLSTFREVDRRFRKAAAEEIERGAKEISARARMYAPIDSGDLTKSIRAQRVTDSTSTKWKVKVGGIQGGRDVSVYALAAHEGRSTNFKSWSLGKKSLAKARALGVKVGPGYLSRAFKELAPLIRRRIQLALRDEARSIGRSASRKK